MCCERGIGRTSGGRCVEHRMKPARQEIQAALQLEQQVSCFTPQSRRNHRQFVHGFTRFHTAPTCVLLLSADWRSASITRGLALTGTQASAMSTFLEVSMDSLLSVW